MFKPQLGLRLRVALAFTITFTLIVSGLGIMLYTASSDLEDTMVDQLLDEETNFLIDRLRQNPDLPPPSSFNIKAYVVRTPADEATLPEYLRKLEVGQHEIFPAGKEIHVTVRGVDDSRVYLAYDVSLHEQREDRFKLLLALCIGGVILLSLTLSYWLAGVLVKQVTDLARAVEKQTPGTATLPLANASQGWEVAQLAHALDDYQARLNQTLQREQEFTANASHELRTPLTAIRTSCELLSADPGLNEKSRQRLAAVDAAARRMTVQIEALLLLARAQTPDAQDPVSIAECIRDAAEPYRADLTRKNVQLEIDAAEDATLRLDAQALHLVLSNLVRNAAQYTQAGHVRIRLDGDCITVADTGSGIAHADLPHVFERHYRARNSDGNGLGLAIVKRICEQRGWRIDIDSQPGAGTTFALHLTGAQPPKNT